MNVLQVGKVGNRVGDASGGCARAGILHIVAGSGSPHANRDRTSVTGTIGNTETLTIVLGMIIVFSCLKFWGPRLLS